jgi:hypothetical protein
MMISKRHTLKQMLTSCGGVELSQGGGGRCDLLEAGNQQANLSSPAGDIRRMATGQ